MMSEFRFGGLVLRKVGRSASNELAPEEYQQLRSDLWLAVSDPVQMRTLARFLDATIMWGDEHLLEVVLEQIADGRIAVEREGNRTVDPTLGLEAVTLARFAEPLTTPNEDQDYAVAIQLIGEDDEPLAGVRYRIELPGGRIAQGRTGDDGQAFIWGLAKSGDCKFTFPDLDEEAWETVDCSPLT